MFEKYIYVNPNEYRVSVKQVSGMLQINELTVNGKCWKQLAKRLDNAIDEVFKVLNKYNKEIERCSKKEKTAKTQPEKQPTIKGLK